MDPAVHAHGLVEQSGLGTRWLILSRGMTARVLREVSRPYLIYKHKVALRDPCISACGIRGRLMQVTGAADSAGKGARSFPFYLSAPCALRCGTWRSGCRILRPRIEIGSAVVETAAEGSC